MTVFVKEMTNKEGIVYLENIKVIQRGIHEERKIRLFGA